MCGVLVVVALARQRNEHGFYSGQYSVIFFSENFLSSTSIVLGQSSLFRLFRHFFPEPAAGSLRPNLIHARAGVFLVSIDQGKWVV